MKYCATPDGVTALRAMARVVTEALETLDGLTSALSSTVEETINLGPHREALIAVLENIGDSVKRALDPVAGVAEHLEDVATGYQEVIDDDPFARSGKGCDASFRNGGASSGGGAAKREFGAGSGKSRGMYHKQQGGSYGSLAKANPGRRGVEEIHHMPANSINGLSSNDGAAIIMHIEDHKKTMSFDKQPYSDAYRRRQEQLVKEGKLLEAFEMDVDDIHSEFGNKYDEAIRQAREYLLELLIH